MCVCAHCRVMPFMEELWSHLLRKSLFKCNFVADVLQVRCMACVNQQCSLGANRGQKHSSLLAGKGYVPSTPNLHPEYQHATKKQNACLCFWALLLIFHKGTWHV